MIFQDTHKHESAIFRANHQRENKKKERTPAHPMPEQLRIWLGHVKHSNPIATHRMCRCVIIDLTLYYYLHARTAPQST